MYNVVGDIVYKTYQQDDVTISQYHDMVNHAEITYIDSVLYVTIKNYLGLLATDFNSSVPVTINGDAQTIDAIEGVGSFGIVSDWLRVTTNYDGIRNGELLIGEPPQPTDRIDDLEKAQADLMFLLVEKGVL